MPTPGSGWVKPSCRGCRGSLPQHLPQICTGTKASSILILHWEEVSQEPSQQVGAGLRLLALRLVTSLYTELLGGLRVTQTSRQMAHLWLGVLQEVVLLPRGEHRRNLHRNACPGGRLGRHTGVSASTLGSDGTTGPASREPRRCPLV